MATEAIQEFLVGVGYKIDETGQRKFNDALLMATANTIKLTVALEAAATAAVGVVQRIASHFETLSYSSERLATSMEHIKRFQYAMSQVGSSAEEALGLLESFGEKLRKTGTEAGSGGRQGSIERYVQSLGATTRGTRGELLQLDDILENLVHSRKFLSEDYRVQVQQFEAIGGSERQLQALLREHVQYTEEYGRKARAFGIDLQKAAEDSRLFERAWRGVWETARLFMQKLGADFEERLAGRIAAFDNWLTEHGPGIVRGFEAIFSIIERLAAMIADAAAKIYDFFSKYIDPWASKVLGVTNATDRLLGILGTAGLIGVLGTLAAAIGGLVFGLPFRILSGFLGMFGLAGAASVAGGLAVAGAVGAGAGIAVAEGASKLLGEPGEGPYGRPEGQTTGGGAGSVSLADRARNWAHRTFGGKDGSTPPAGQPEAPSAPREGMNIGPQGKTGGTRSWRNNNPGNIEYGQFARDHGAIGSDGRFAIFPTEEDGRSAQRALLTGNAYRNLTIPQAIAKWAPASDNNNVSAYANGILGGTGASANTRIADLSPAQMERFLDTMKRIEGWVPGHGGTPVVRNTPPAPKLHAMAEGAQAANVGPTSAIGATAKWAHEGSSGPAKVSAQTNITINEKSAAANQDHGATHYPKPALNADGHAVRGVITPAQ